MQERNFIPISTGEPTHWPSDKNKLPELIDFAVAKGITSNSTTATSCLDLTSDHSPIIIIIKSSINHKGNSNVYSNNFNNKVDWEKYRAILNENISCNVPPKTPEDQKTQ